MDKDELTAWALKNGWRMIDGHPSLAKPARPKEAIVKLVFKTTTVALEVKRPAGKWDKVASAAYAAVTADEDGGVPQGLGLDSFVFTKLMQDNKDQQVFGS